MSKIPQMRIFLLGSYKNLDYSADFLGDAYKNPACLVETVCSE